MPADLQDLFERVKALRMTPEEPEAQRRSFAYGNVRLSNDLVTREMIDEAAERLARREQ